MAVLFFIILTFSSLCTTIKSVTLRPSESLAYGQTLTSPGGTFQLGFFRPSTSSNHRFVGIWYTKIPVQTVVWVANRDSPLNDTSGVLKISSYGNLVIVLNQTDKIIWSSNTTKAVENPIVEFLESGNLVLRDSKNNGSKRYLWQSFEYPSDTLLPGMKLGWNLKTGRNWYLTSWKRVDDPSPGEYTFGLEVGTFPEAVIRKGLDLYFRVGSWNGLQFSGGPELEPNPRFTYEFVDNAEEKYFIYHMVDPSNLVRCVVSQTSSQGVFQILAWVNKTNSWVPQCTVPRDNCDQYALCGANSFCAVTTVEICQCLEGFTPTSPGDWSRLDWSLGCQRRVPINCSHDEGFKVYTGMRLPDSRTDSWTNRSTTLEECRLKCLNNCSCTAYANSDITDGGHGCIMWHTNLVDIRKLADHPKQDLHIRMASSELAISKTEGSAMLKVVITSVVGVIAFCLGGLFIWKRRSLKGDRVGDASDLHLYSKRDDPELPLFDMVTIVSATNNFSPESKLGEGGFGPVYKGTLDGGEDIAVKRLSRNSHQGVTEFKNEVILIAKLQHRNLVRILGCCVERNEKILVYEYMQNDSLDSYIFNETKSPLLDWEKRSQILLGIARGLLYLHHDSRLRIIHRDLKASNILLDREMIAKISDFGLARIFHGDALEARTKRVVGTRGYMSPEYAVDGYFSVKSDVFSYGVLVLEIISGKRNWGFSHPEHGLNLLGHAWRLWSEDKTMELVDNSIAMSSSSIEDISRCVHIGLLCVQKRANQRPTMSSVVLMLTSETAVLPRPQPPGFYIERSIISEDASAEQEPGISINNVTVTDLEAR